MQGINLLQILDVPAEGYKCTKQLNLVGIATGIAVL